MDQLELSKLFEKLGAQNPKAWAYSQFEERIPQLARFLFLREAWKLVVADNDANWIPRMLKINPDSPGGDIGASIARLLAAGGSQNDLTKVVRVMQWQLLSGICQLLDDPGDLEAEVNQIAWRLFQVDENDRPTVVIGGLIESLLETEPSGRQMRSR